MNYFFSVFALFLLLSCEMANTSKYPSGLPVWGEKLAVQKEVNGKMVIDSLEHIVSDFSFINQDSQVVTQELVKGKIYLVDFFFTSCPTICPKVKKNMKKVYEKFKDKPDFLILSHSIDVKYDTVGRLAWFANKFDISSKTWHLLTGKKEDIYKMAYEYFITALESDDAPGGFDHSGGVALIDRNRKVRGMYDGTDPEKMKDLIRDIELLMEKE